MLVHLEKLNNANLWWLQSRVLIEKMLLTFFDCIEIFSRNVCIQFHDLIVWNVKICFNCFFLFSFKNNENNRKCGSPKKQNLSAIGRALGAAGPASSSEKSQQLIVPSRSYAFEVTGDVICPGFVQGIDHLRDPRLNKVISNSFVFE